MRGILGFYIVLKPKINIKHTLNVNFCLKATVIPSTKTNRLRSDRRITTNKKNRDSAIDEYIIKRRMVAFLALSHRLITIMVVLVASCVRKRSCMVSTLGD